MTVNRMGCEVLALPQCQRAEEAPLHRSLSFARDDGSVVLESVLSADLPERRPLRAADKDAAAEQDSAPTLASWGADVGGPCTGRKLYVEIALEVDLVKEVLRVEVAALVQRSNLLDNIVFSNPRRVFYSSAKKARHSTRTLSTANPVLLTAGPPTALSTRQRVTSPVLTAPPLLPGCVDSRVSGLSEDVEVESLLSLVDSKAVCASSVGASETTASAADSCSKPGEADPCTCTAEVGVGEETTTTSSSSSSSSSSSDSDSRGRSGGGYWGVQRILGAARAVCRWLSSWRRTCCEVVAVGGSVLGVARGRTGTASAGRFGPWRLVVLLLQRGPNVMLTLWPSLPFLGSLRLPSMPTTTTGLCSSAALLAFGLTPLLGGSSSLLAHASEAVSAAFSCWSTASHSVSQFAANSAHMSSLLSSCLTLRAPLGVDFLAAADFGFTAAAFTHLLVTPALRWRHGHGAHYQLHPSVPPATQELGFLAKVMYDTELPERVKLAGRTLTLLPRASDVRMAVYVSEELLHGSGDGRGGRVAVCHRGTWSPADLLDDMHLLTGCFRASARYREAVARSNALLAAWPAATFTHVGHSLGGSVAMALVQRMPMHVEAEAHAFNPGISLEGFASARSKVHLIAGDVVGYGAPAHRGAECHVYPAHSGVRYLPAFAHPHSVTNFW